MVYSNLKALDKIKSKTKWKKTNEQINLVGLRPS